MLLSQMPPLYMKVATVLAVILLQCVFSLAHFLTSSPATEKKILDTLTSSKNIPSNQSTDLGNKKTL